MSLVALDLIQVRYVQGRGGGYRRRYGKGVRTGKQERFPGAGIEVLAGRVKGRKIGGPVRDALITGCEGQQDCGKSRCRQQGSRLVIFMYSA